MKTLYYEKNISKLLKTIRIQMYLQTHLIPYIELFDQKLYLYHTYLLY